jgi:hypothetical protein
MNMTWRDKLEIDSGPDAPFRRDNLPDGEIHGPSGRPVRADPRGRGCSTTTLGAEPHPGASGPQAPQGVELAGSSLPRPEVGSLAAWPRR